MPEDDAMAKDSRNGLTNEAAQVDEATSLETRSRQRARGLIDAIVEEELEAALGAAESARVGPARQGSICCIRRRSSARSRIHSLNRGHSRSSASWATSTALAPPAVSNTSSRSRSN